MNPFPVAVHEYRRAHTSMGTVVQEQRLAYRTTTPLFNHINSAHAGHVLPSCPACIEIQRRMKIVQQSS